MHATDAPLNAAYVQLLRDAFIVLDRYSARIANRDRAKSLNEDRRELLCRVRAALQPLMFDGAIGRDDVTEIARRLDDFLTNECPAPQKPVPRMGMSS